jgi:hypothetical protein
MSIKEKLDILNKADITENTLRIKITEEMAFLCQL